MPEAPNCEPLFALKMYQEHSARYLFASQAIQGRAVLDVGCGVGYGSQLLASRGAESVTAFDISSEAIKHAEMYYPHRNLSFSVASAEDFSFGRQFDVVTCFELIEHVGNQYRAIEKIAAALKEDGLLVISTPRPLDKVRSAYHARELSLLDFSRLLADGFPHVEWFFENNHFASLVAGSAPKSIEEIYALHPQFELGQADYFVAVASRRAIDRGLFRDQLVLNNDAYVRNLERDVDILHQIENDLKAKLEAAAAQTQQREQLTAELEAAAAQTQQREDEFRKLEAAAAQSRQREQELTAKLEAAAAQTQQRADELRQLEAVAAQSKQRADEFEKKFEEASTHSQHRETELNAKLADLSSLRRQREEELTAKLEAATALGQHRENELAKKLEEELKKQREDLSTKSQQQIAALSAENFLNETQLEVELEQLKTATGSLEANLARAKTSLRQLQRRYKDDVANLLAELERFEVQSHQLAYWRNAAQERDAQIKAICDSRSWRVTAPIRSFAGSVRGGPRWSVMIRPLLSDAEVVSSVNGNGHTAAGGEQASSPVAVDSQTPSKADRGISYLDVLYVIGCHDGESKRYRVHNLVEGLKQLGYSAASVRQDEIPNMLHGRFIARAVVLFRCAFDQHVDQLLQYCEKNKIETIFDIDDLVFEPESIGFVHVVSTFNEAELALYRDGVERYRRTLLGCNRATCTTAFLARRMENLGVRADVIPNSLNGEQLSLARALPSNQTRDAQVVRVGYFSGSNTHQVDFEACESALLVAMESHPEVRFVLGGLLELEPEWNRFADRIERHPMLPPAELLKLIATIDINLAPLEMGNPYAHCKSELKIFEAGAVKVPTIASAIESYSAAIDSGQDGFLASSPEEWLAALQQLIKSPELRRSMGEKARQRALSQFGPEVVAQQAERVYDLFTGESPLESSDQNAGPRLKITWIIPKLIIGGGGHRNILRAAYYLEKFGHSLELYFTDSDLTPNQLSEAVRAHFYPLRCPMYKYEGSIRPTDVLFATHWTTVSAAMRCKDSAREIIYFVQDFEPAFAPMGTEYILAENTYRLGLYCITSGPWCEKFLKKEFGCPADHFLFPVDRTVYHPRARSKKETNVVFFAKPEMPRRCFELGVMALEEFNRLRPDVEIILFGSQHVQSKPLPVPAPVRNLLRRVGNPNTPNVAPLPFPATVKSLLPGIDDLAKMYADADLGIVFSTTNPSLVPYEMMACGLPIVDLERPGNETNYAGRTDIAVLANPDPAAMARRISDLLANPEEMSGRSQRGLEFVQTFPSEEEMARRVEELILARMTSKQRVLRTAGS